MRLHLQFVYFLHQICFKLSFYLVLWICLYVKFKSCLKDINIGYVDLVAVSIWEVTGSSNVRNFSGNGIWMQTNYPNFKQSQQLSSPINFNCFPLNVQLKRNEVQFLVNFCVLISSETFVLLVIRMNLSEHQLCQMQKSQVESCSQFCKHQ